jgi:hypothetical protein
MIQNIIRNLILISFFCFPLFSCFAPTRDRNSLESVYISDLKVVNSGDVHGGVGKDKPYWTDQLIICGIKYDKGIILHPENDGIIAFAEFPLQKKGGRLTGMAGWAEQEDAIYDGIMRFRFFADGKLLYSGEIKGKKCEEVNYYLGAAEILRIETDDGFDGNYADHMAFGDLRIVY